MLIGFRPVAGAFILLGILLMVTGASCAQTAAGPVGDGLKTIFGGVVDGAVAAVKAGR